MAFHQNPPKFAGVALFVNINELREQSGLHIFNIKISQRQIHSLIRLFCLDYPVASSVDSKTYRRIWRASKWA